MRYDGAEYKTMGDIFRLALSLAKYGNRKVCQDFMDKYCLYICKENNTTKDEALKIAQSNLGYYAGYYNREVYELVNKFYGAIHPVFKKNPFDVSPEEAYLEGLKHGLPNNLEKV